MFFKLIHSEVIYAGRAFTVRRDHVQLPDGRDSKLDIVDHVGSVVILPVDEQGNLLFVRQYRHAAQQDLLELPAGTLNGNEDPQACAQRELREETGLAADSLTDLGGFFLAPGYSTEYMHVFLATGLHLDPLEADADEFLSVERMPIQEVFTASARGSLPDAKSLAALFLASRHLDGLARNPARMGS